MNTYISMLRGINVSGQKLIKMADLKALYEALGFTNVQTYIQSGNVIFKSKEKKASVVAEMISKQIQKNYNFHIPVIIRTIPEIQHLISINPFRQEIHSSSKGLYVVFMETVPTPENLSTFQKLDYSPEKFVIAQNEVFLYVPQGYGKAKLSNNFIEQKLKINTTARNWKTVNKLLEIAEKAAHN